MEKFQKPETCILCCESMNEKKPLECGHWLHLKCVEKHFKPECPICRKHLDIKVTGTRPEPYIPVEETGLSVDVIYDIMGPMIEHEFENENEDENDCTTEKEGWEINGYLYPEEDPSYDEENPHSDNYDYEDY